MRRDEKSMEQQYDGNFGKEHSYSGYNLNVAKNLSVLSSVFLTCNDGACRLRFYRFELLVVCH